VLVGIFTAILDYSVTMLLTYFGLHRSAAKAMGWVFGTVAAYLVNARWTFGAKISGKAAISVALLYASTSAVQNVLYWLLKSPSQTSRFDGLVKDTIAFVIAQGVATETNFVIQRVFVFKSK